MTQLSLSYSSLCAVTCYELPPNTLQYSQQTIMLHSSMDQGSRRQRARVSAEVVVTVSPRAVVTGTGRSASKSVHLISRLLFLVCCWLTLQVLLTRDPPGLPECPHDTAVKLPQGNRSYRQRERENKQNNSRQKPPSFYDLIQETT